MTTATTKLRRTRHENRASIEKRGPMNSELPALAQERARLREMFNMPPGMRLNNSTTTGRYKTGDGEVPQPQRPGSERAATLPSVGVRC